jgi:drug/metabolite transporter (DMT)-like permease
MNVGLLYTPVSIFQMTRGALVFFVGILSMVFLRRRMYFYQCVAYHRITQILHKVSGGFLLPLSFLA